MSLQTFGTIDPSLMDLPTGRKHVPFTPEELAKAIADNKITEVFKEGFSMKPGDIVVINALGYSRTVDTKTNNETWSPVLGVTITRGTEVIQKTISMSPFTQAWPTSGSSIDGIHSAHIKKVDDFCLLAAQTPNAVLKYEGESTNQEFVEKKIQPVNGQRILVKATVRYKFDTRNSQTGVEREITRRHVLATLA